MATRTIKEIAADWEVSPRSIRKFLRSEIRSQGGTIGEDSPGKGGRYAIEARSLKSLKRRYFAWIAANAPKGDDAPDTTEIAETDAIDADTPIDEEIA